ncbi:hypothetical protein VNO77_44660 [Canavalia gladiata]|uniref:Uncharacterized protein n=1 Tax=Canavalia gladiata TaxID=3824 RepID=A0AAN9JWC9_CANGL
MSVACEVAMREMKDDEKRISSLQEKVLNGIRQKLDGMVVNKAWKGVEGGDYLQWQCLHLEPSSVLGVDEDMTTSPR